MKKLIKILIMAIGVLVLYIANALFISPAISGIIIKDVISSPHINEILLYMSGLLPIAATFFGYAFIIKEIIDKDVKSALPYMIVYQLSSFFALVVTLICEYIRAGSLPAADELFYNFVSIVLNFLLIAVMMYVIAYATHRIKKRGSSSALEVTSFTAAIVEAIKQLIVELSYIIPFLFEYSFDISAGEVLSMLISILWVIFVFGIGYVITKYTQKLIK